MASVVYRSNICYHLGQICCRRTSGRVPLVKSWNWGLLRRTVSTKSAPRRSSDISFIGALVGTLTGLGLAANKHKLSLAKERSVPSQEVATSGKPVYSAEEVAEHNTREKRIWVTYKDNVYDITDFIDSHPGGSKKIILAAGKPLEPFWALYAVHNTQHILDLLEEYHIGTLSVDKASSQSTDIKDPYVKDPARHTALKINTKKPFNAETPIQLLTESVITPNEIFFIRNHLPVPDIDSNKYELEITGEGINTTKLSLEDLKTKFPKRTITVTIQCAGNRRSEMNRIKVVKGLNWGAGAISTATWTGAPLRDILRYAGLDEVSVRNTAVEHAQFEGADQDITGSSYGASVPINTALSADGDVLVAYEMNGVPIPRDHGFPVRVVVPGVVGARNVKWLTRIIASKEESPSHWQQNDYKGFSPSVAWDTVDFKSAPAIQELPVTSAICDPPDGATISADEGEISVQGYAWSGGGREIVRVDVSLDGGNNWHLAELEGPQQDLAHSWGWKLWRATLTLPEGLNSLEICAKAIDSSYNSQPENVAPIWNLRGVLSHAWHRVNVTVTRD